MVEGKRTVTVRSRFGSLLSSISSVVTGEELIRFFHLHPLSEGGGNNVVVSV